MFVFFLLIRYLKLSKVLVAVGQRDINNVFTRVGDVEQDAVGRDGNGGVNHDAGVGSHLGIDLSQVLGEEDGEHVTVN